VPRKYCATMGPVFKAVVKWRLLATALLCVVVLAASVDRLPDPPALRPFRSEAKTSCLDPHFDGYCKDDGKSTGVAFTPVYIVRWFDFGYVFEADHAIRHASLFGQASDSSPPNFVSRT